jgi:hypothetical protein
MTVIQSVYFKHQGEGTTAGLCENETPFLVWNAFVALGKEAGA